MEQAIVMIEYGVLAVLILSQALVLWRALKGPTIYDRLLAVNNFGTKTMLLIVLLCVITGSAVYLDVALVYGLINFITTIGVLKYSRYRSFGT